MASTTRITSREFNQDVGRAKRAAANGPVVVTDRGKPAYVLLRHDHYAKLVSGKRRSIVDMLQQRGGDAIAFDPSKLKGLIQPADL